MICKYVDENSLAAMLAAKRSAGVAPDVNLRILLCVGNKAHKQGDATLALKPRADITSEVQNRGISGPTKRNDVL